MEQMADALERAAELFERIYASQHNRMRVAAIAAGAVLAGDDQQNADTFRPTQMTASASAADITAAKAAATVPVGRLLSTAAAATAELAALEAAEATLHVALRQEVLSRLIAVQVSLAKESVSWKRGVLATPQVCPATSRATRKPRWISICLCITLHELLLSFHMCMATHLCSIVGMVNVYYCMTLFA